jgi:ABC-type lipoprotein export system ATPase subunit
MSNMEEQEEGAHVSAHDEREKNQRALTANTWDERSELFCMTAKQSPLLEQAERHAGLIEATEVSKTYETGKHQIQALQGVSLRIQRGEVVAVMGPSGCGKTTLLNCLSGLDQVTSGTIRIASQDIRGLSDRELTAFRACEMGFVFQTYNLLPVLSGLENVELPLLVSGVRPREARERALASIERVGLRAWGRHRPAEMSGGQRQRFAIARALATSPSIVWADEPTGALDSRTSQEIIDLMLSLNREHGLTFVWVTHALEVAMQAQRLITMQDGRVQSDRHVDPSLPSSPHVGLSQEHVPNRPNP